MLDNVKREYKPGEPRVPEEMIPKDEEPKTGPIALLWFINPEFDPGYMSDDAIREAKDLVMYIVRRIPQPQQTAIICQWGLKPPDFAALSARDTALMMGESEERVRNMTLWAEQKYILDDITKGLVLMSMKDIMQRHKPKERDD